MWSGFLALAMSISTAVADAPAVHVDENHHVRGTVLVDADEAAVRSLVSDPLKVAEVDANGAQIKVRRAGDCKELSTLIQHAVATIRYDARQCPTARGWRMNLLRSDDLEEFYAEWEVVPKDGRVELRYSIRTIPRIAVPQWMVDRQTRNSVKTMLTRIKRAVESR